MTVAPSTQALRALAAAWETRQVYGADHEAFRLAVERCIAALEDVTRAAGAMTLAICDDGVVWGDQIVNDRTLASSAFLGSLAARGSTCLRISAGVTSQDVEWMLGGGGNAQTPRSPSGKITVGKLAAVNPRMKGERAGSGSGGGGGGLIEPGAAAGLYMPGATTADHTPLKEALSSLLAGAKRVPKEVGSMAAQIMSAVLTSRSGLVSLVDLKDHDEYTFVHAVNVGLLASSLGQAVGLTGERLSQVTEAALLHDVGKRLIPLSILGKKGALDASERSLMQTHPARGATLLAGVRGVTDLAVVAAYEHHMRIDGKGYPVSPRGRFPSLTTQLIQIADIFDALRSDRPYRAGLSILECVQIMNKDSGTSFDRELFETFKNQVLCRFCVPGQDAPPKRDAA